MNEQDDRRRAPRLEVDATADLIAGGLSKPAVICDISPGGVRLDTGGRSVAAGARVYIRLATYGLRQAKVVWSDDGSIGVQFLDPIGMQPNENDLGGRRRTAR